MTKSQSVRDKAVRAVAKYLQSAIPTLKADAYAYLVEIRAIEATLPNENGLDRLRRDARTDRIAYDAAVWLAEEASKKVELDGALAGFFLIRAELARFVFDVLHKRFLPPRKGRYDARARREMILGAVRAAIDVGVGRHVANGIVAESLSRKWKHTSEKAVQSISERYL